MGYVVVRYSTLHYFYYYLVVQSARDVHAVVLAEVFENKSYKPTYNLFNCGLLNYDDGTCIWKHIW